MFINDKKCNKWKRYRFVVKINVREGIFLYSKIKEDVFEEVIFYLKFEG